jgi:hypothetical protein
MMGKKAKKESSKCNEITLHLKEDIYQLNMKANK